MAKFASIKSFNVEVSNSDDESRVYDIKAQARIDNGKFYMLEAGEIRRKGGDSVLAQFHRYEGSGNVSIQSADITLTEAAKAADDFYAAVKADDTDREAQLV